MGRITASPCHDGALADALAEARVDVLARLGLALKRWAAAAETSCFWRLKQNRCNQSIRTKIIAKRIDTFPSAPGFLQTQFCQQTIAEARVTLPQSARVAGLDCLQHRSDSMVKCMTLATSAGNLIGDNQNSITCSTSLKKIMKRIGKIATAFAIAFSAFALTATSGSAQNVPPAIIPPGHYCLSYDGGGFDCSFASYAQCEATASGQDAECYGNTPADDEDPWRTRARQGQGRLRQ